jgi:tetratricopeptide (TPR) repeat protein
MQGRATRLVWRETESMSVDISSLWDFDHPDVSERHFLDALAGASADDGLILKTQIARTYGLRGDFSRAQRLLSELEPELRSAGPAPKVHYYLELGRTCCSATHAPASQTAEVRGRARAAYMNALSVARDAGLDGLAIDALHMMTFVDTAPEAQLEWNLKALKLMEESSQPAAQRWAASLHNNIGYALHLLGRYEEALHEFELALVERERDIRVAHWMIAWTLRALGRTDEALDIQLRLELECEAADVSDPYVFEELEQLYRALGDEEKAAFYAARRGRMVEDGP